jgi:hypothetical protein
MGNAASFWSWFVRHEHRFRDIEVPDKELLLDEILEHLHEFSTQLWFEVGGGPQGPLELIISAEGKTSAFPLVRELVTAAPNIPGWKVFAFKQPQGFAFVTNYNDVTVAPSATWFMPLLKAGDSSSMGLRAAYSHYDARKHQAFLTATYIMLEAGLGELSAAEHINHVEVCIAPSAPESSGYRALTELPAFIAERYG